MRFLAPVLTPLLLLPLTACGEGSSDTAGDGPALASRQVRPERLPDEDFDSTELGALFGEIRFRGEAPERFPIGARKKSECTHHPEIAHLSDIIVVEDGKVAGVLVRVTRGFDADDIPPVPEESVVLDQRGCTYTPHIVALRVGQTLEVRNSDPTTHNVNAKPKKNRGPGNRNMGQGQDALRVVFDQPEVSIHFKCDIHPWMEARVHVLEHPWFDISDSDGTFRIEGLPPGTYTVEALHEKFGKLSAKEIEVEAGRATGFALSFEG